MARIDINSQKLSVGSSTQIHQLGDTFETTSPGGNVVKYVYRKNTVGSTLTQYGAYVAAYAWGVAVPTTAKLAFKPLISMAALTANQYGWFAYSGEVEGNVVANASATAIAAGANLQITNGLTTLSVVSTSPNGHIIAVDAATTTTTITIQLEG